MDYWNLYKDVWNFHKKYAVPQEDEAFWKSLMDESHRIANQYSDHEFALALLVAVINELERICKGGKENADSTVQGLHA